MTENDKEKYFENYVKSLATIDVAIEPLKEQRKSLKQNYLENGWLTKEEEKVCKKAYRLLKGKVDIDELVKCCKTINPSVRGEMV